jgi:hypothetical protein
MDKIKWTSLIRFPLDLTHSTNAHSGRIIQVTSRCDAKVVNICNSLFKYHFINLRPAQKVQLKVISQIVSLANPKVWILRSLALENELVNNALNWLMPRAASVIWR